MNKYLYIGVSNSGKTSILKEKYEWMIQEGIDESKIMVFINSKSQSSIWEDVEANTFYKIIRNHILLFWPLVEEKIKSGKNIPKFLEMEISEYLLNKLVDKYRENGRFLDIHISSAVLSSDILNNIAKLSLNSIPFNDIEKLLNRFLYEDLLVKDNILSIKNIIHVFISRNISEGVLNFSLACYLYDKYILNHPLYKEYLKRNIEYLVVDDLQEKTFLEVKFIEKLLEIVKEAHLAYNIDGPITRILGCDETSIKEKIFPKCSIVKVDRKKMIEKEKIKTKNTTLRSEMIVKIGDKIKRLIEEGYKKEEIDIVGPFIDPILENRLKKEMEKRGLYLKIMSRGGTLTDNPFINGLITICLLVHINWGILPNKDAIAKTLSLILNIDMIRARYLTKEITRKEPYELPSAHEIEGEYMEKEDLQKYEVLRSWIYEHRKVELDMDLFLKKLFLDILLPLEVDKENLNACHYLIHLSKEFLEYARENEKLKIEKNKNFVDMILKGIRMTGRDEKEEEGIKLWTPYSYLLSSKKSKVQIWTDATSDVWHQVGIKRYYNPFIFLKENRKKIWNLEEEEKYKDLQTHSILKNLLRKAEKEIYIFGSEFNSNGYEQRGEVLRYLNEIQEGERLYEMERRTN